MPEVQSRRRHRRRRSDEEYEREEDGGGGFGGWKLGLVIGVIVVCFAVVYPHVFHPLLMSFLGRSDPAPATNTHRPPSHPSMAGRGPMGSRGPGGGAGDHPAMRMAAAQAEAQSAGKGGARSMYTFMIPIYTVGVIGFLLYTMFKSKKKNRRARRRGSDDEYSDDDEEDEPRGGGRKPLGGRKMRDLQERLRQTESAMSKILEQLEKAQSEGKLTPEMLANLGSQEEQKKKEVPKSSSKPKKMSKKAAEPAKVDKTLETVAQQLPDEQTTQYMEDLEKALADFKELSDLYENAQGGRRRRQASESEDSEEEEGAESGSEEEEEEDASSEEEEAAAEGEEEEEEEEENSKASSTHPFPEEEPEEHASDDDQDQKDNEPEDTEEDEEPVESPPPAAPKEDKIRRRKPPRI